MAIHGYSIGGYWWLLVAIGGYFINDYCDYSINGYCDYSINGYCDYSINDY
jgi:hypothetical protein